MGNDILLPDYLPSRYNNWLELYLEVLRIFKEQGFEVNEGTEIKLFQLGDFDEVEMMKKFSEQVVYFYHNFPLSLIKSRALDFVLSNLPTYAQMQKVRSKSTMAFHVYDESDWNIFENLLTITRNIQ